MLKSQKALKNKQKSSKSQKLNGHSKPAEKGPEIQIIRDYNGDGSSNFIEGGNNTTDFNPSNINNNDQDTNKQ